MERLQAVPVWAWLGLAAAAGALFLCWHAFENDDADVSWLDPCQPPAQVLLPAVPGQHGCCPPMACGPAMRGRSQPDSIASVNAALEVG